MSDIEETIRKVNNDLDHMLVTRLTIRELADFAEAVKFGSVGDFDCMQKEAERILSEFAKVITNAGT